MIIGEKSQEISKLLQELSDLLQKLAFICKVTVNYLLLGAIAIWRLPQICTINIRRKPSLNFVKTEIFF